MRCKFLWSLTLKCEAAMTFAYVMNTVLTSSILLFVLYTCFVTLVLCLWYLIEEESQRIIEQKREQRELLGRSERSIDAVVDEIYES